MSNFIFPKTKISTFAFLLFSVTVIAAIASFLVMISASNNSKIRRQLSRHTPEIILTEINEHVEQQEDAINQHVQQAQTLLDQHMQQAELSWDETLQQSDQIVETLVTAK